MLLLGPFVDRTITGEWVSSFNYSGPVIFLILLSCIVAILVNLSAFMCLGRFSPVSYQVMGQMKTIFILTGGFLFFSEELSMKQMLGITFAVVGKGEEFVKFFQIDTLPEVSPYPLVLDNILKKYPNGIGWTCKACKDACCTHC